LSPASVRFLPDFYYLKGVRSTESQKKIMDRILITIIAFLVVFFLELGTASAQFNIKLPDIKIKKPDNPKVRETTKDTTGIGKTRSKQPIYSNQRPTNVPVFLKTSLYLQAVTHDQYWKMKGQSNYSSWVPEIRFNQFYNNEKELNYTVEYVNPDGSVWYSEKLESQGGNAESTVLYKSPSPYGGVLNNKSTDKIGVFGFKITNADTKEVLFQGKFKVGKFSRAYSAAEKNKVDFFVDQDWLLPFGILGFHHSDIELGGMMPLISFWLKGQVDAHQLEGRVFYQGKQIASTKDGESGVSDYDERRSEYAPAFSPQNIWKRWQFQFNNFRVDNNGDFNRDYYPNAHYADKHPGDYTVKIYRNGTQIREMSFSVGADKKFVAPAYASQIPLPYHRLVLPVKITDTTEKWDITGWKTNAFYGNPLTGFSVQ